MTHPIIMSFLIYGTSRPLHLSFPIVVVYNIAIIITSYIFGLIIHLTIEAPFMALLKVLMMKSKDKNKNEIKSENENDLKSSNLDHEIKVWTIKL